MQSPKSFSENSFEAKWSEAIAFKGFTEVPNCLIVCQAKLGISNSELTVMLHLLRFKFTTKHPYPSASTLAKSMGQSVNAVRRNIKSLDDKKLLGRGYRAGYTSEYDFTLLIHRLENHDCINPIQKRAAVSSKMNRPPYSELNTKEYKSRRKFNNNSKPTSLKDILGKRSYNG